MQSVSDSIGSYDTTIIS